MLNAKDIGRNVKAKRKSLGWTQEEASWNCGVSDVTLRRIERGKAKNMELGTMLKVRDGLMMTDQEFIAD